jgi:hypothetical protein
MHEGDTSGLTTAITAGTTATSQIAATITAAQNRLASPGNLTAAQIANLTTALNAALTAQTNLAAALTAAQNALAALNTALNSGNAAQIAAAVTAAQQATANLNAAIAGEAQANANLNAALSVSAASVQPTQTQTSTSQTVVTTIPTGAITWAPGFGPNGAVASVQTAPASGMTTETASTPTAVAGVQTAPQSGSAAAGVSNLPSTNTGDTNGLLGLGAALMALGAYLVRLPTKSRK